MELNVIYAAIIINYVILGIFTFYLYQFWKTKGHLVGWAKAYAGIQGERAGVSRRQQRDAKLIQSGQSKIVNTVAEQVPGAASILKSSGVSDSEAFALMTDPDTMKGIKVILDTVGGVLKAVTPGEGGGRPKRARKNAGQAPLIEFREQ